MTDFRRLIGDASHALERYQELASASTGLEKLLELRAAWDEASRLLTTADAVVDASSAISPTQRRVHTELVYKMRGELGSRP